MIDRAHFGRRAAAAREKLGLSQTRLAERLDVTPQAVSKWERGLSLPAVETLLRLSRLAGITVNDLLEEPDPIKALTGQSPLSDGVHLFVPEKERPEFAAWAEEMAREGWVRANWKKAGERGKPWSRYGDLIAGHGGLILEIGAGPGGGFMPFVLRSDPDARIIVSDLSPTVVREWKAFLGGRPYSNLCFAAMDFTALPLPDGCVDVVSDCGGTDNTVGSNRAAFREAYRVLKPGGIFVTTALFVSPDAEEGLPPAVRRNLREQAPCLFEDPYGMTASAGFRRIDSELMEERETDREDSGFADLCRSLGVNLRISRCARICRKD